jgi:hypothetical protein
MFEQIHTQTLNLTKQFAQNLVKTNQILVESFEKTVDLQLKHLDQHLSNLTTFANELTQVRDAEGFREVLPKSVSFVKQSGELSQVALKDLLNVASKAGESLTAAAKAGAETAAQEVGVKASKRAA